MEDDAPEGGDIVMGLDWGWGGGKVKRSVRWYVGVCGEKFRSEYSSSGEGERKGWGCFEKLR